MNGNWSWNTFLESIPYIVKGIPITIGLTIACFLVALIFGFVWVINSYIPLNFIKKPVQFLRMFIYSTPPLVQLFFLFYALPMVPVIGVTLNPYVCAILGLGIHYSTYIGEIYRSGIESVDKGQWEAATALNFSKRDKWIKIIFPQAIPPTIPMLGNYLIIMFKEVPITAIIGVVGILSLANSFGALNFAYLEPLTVVGIIFLVLSVPASILVNKIESKINNKDLFAVKNKKKHSDEKLKDLSAERSNQVV